MSNLVVAPIVIPLLTGALLLFAPRQLTWQRTASLVSVSFGVIISMLLMHRVWNDGIQVFFSGNLQAPFGIAIVADLTSVAFVLATSLAALAVILFSFHSLDKWQEKH